MKETLALSKGTSIRGAQMGRPDWLPQDINSPIKLWLEKLKWVDADYDQGGAYWGKPDSGENVYCAWGKCGISYTLVQVFVWAKSRDEAKTLVKEKLPNAIFFH